MLYHERGLYAWKYSVYTTGNKQQTVVYVIIFIIHPYDPTVVICYLIWPCDTAVRITHQLSVSHTVSHSVFPAGALKALVLRTRASRAPAVQTS